jgi:IS30 family transposase
MAAKITEDERRQIRKLLSQGLSSDEVSQTPIAHAGAEEES